MLFNDKALIITVLLCVSVLAFMLCGCGESAEQYKSGGTTNKTDYSAPKEIKSEKLVSLSVGFFHEGDYGKEGDRYYTFKIGPDENGILILQDDETGNNKIEVDASVLTDLQTIIKKYNLVQMNGYNKLTAGLPPQFDTCYFEAVYDSGEYISFKENSDPSAEWSGEIRDYFAKVYSQNGDDKYLPPEETGKVIQFKMTYKDGDRGYFINELMVPNEENYITLEVFDYASSEVVLQERAPITQKMYDDISKLVKENKLSEFANEESFPDDVSDDYGILQYYEFYVKFEYGNRLEGYSDDSEMFKQFLPKGEKITNYLETYMEENGEVIEE